jgi:hypothetical protein
MWYDINHFQLFSGAHAALIASDQVDWLRLTILAGKTPHAPVPIGRWGPRRLAGRYTGFRRAS